MALLTQLTGKTPTQNRGKFEAGLGGAGVGVDTAGLKVTEYGGQGPFHQTLFTFTSFPITITDALAYVGTKIYDFPQGYISGIAAHFAGTLTTTSAIASTLNSGVVVNIGFGTVTASSVTLATTMMNFCPGSGETPSGFTSSTTINVASAEISQVFAATVSAAHLAANINGTSTAADLYLNLAVATATDIDADATVELNGEYMLSWMNTFVDI